MIIPIHKFKANSQIQQIFLSTRRPKIEPLTELKINSTPTTAPLETIFREEEGHKPFRDRGGKQVLASASAWASSNKSTPAILIVFLLGERATRSSINTLITRWTKKKRDDRRNVRELKRRRCNRFAIIRESRKKRGLLIRWVYGKMPFVEGVVLCSARLLWSGFDWFLLL